MTRIQTKQVTLAYSCWFVPVPGLVLSQACLYQDTVKESASDWSCRRVEVATRELGNACIQDNARMSEPKLPKDFAFSQQVSPNA